MGSLHYELNGVCKGFRQAAVPGLQDINLQIGRGEALAVIAEDTVSSTLLHLLAGQLIPCAGSILFDGQPLTDSLSECALIVRHPPLLPWLTIWENLENDVASAFADLMGPAEREAWIHHNLALVHMGHAMYKRPGEISSGMRLRVGIARALALKSSVLLLDEPFAALDSATRIYLQEELLQLQYALGYTLVLATRCVDEALLMADRILLFGQGEHAARISAVIPVDLPRPRERIELSLDPRYQDYRLQLQRALGNTGLDCLATA